MRLIDADKLKAKKKYCFEIKSGVFPQSDYFIKLTDIINAPTVEAEPIRHGHWTITDQDVMGCKEYTCSICGHDTEGWKATHYCENCGAKMDEVIDNG